MSVSVLSILMLVGFLIFLFFEDFILFFITLFFKVYFFILRERERDRESECEWGGQKEREREFQAGSTL